MKKLALAAVVTMVASLGAVVSGQGAQAADPYPGFVPTNCRIKVDHNSGKRKAVRIMTLVEVPSSKAQPKGFIRVVVKKNGGKVVFDEYVSQQAGSTQKFFGPRWRKGSKYKAKIQFVPTTGSVFLACERSATFKPKKKF
jgi:hypothetical protein